jgi:hypothetical protein
VFNFYDFPQRPSAELAAYNFNKGPIQWMAEDFLVNDTGMVAGKEAINVYGGIEYGWQVTLVPEPSTCSLAGAALLIIFGMKFHRKLRVTGSKTD